jgi:uncharacterized protein (DUF1810 family)
MAGQCIHHPECACVNQGGFKDVVVLRLRAPRSELGTIHRFHLRHQATREAIGTPAARKHHASINAVEQRMPKTAKFEVDQAHLFSGEEDIIGTGIAMDP